MNEAETANESTFTDADITILMAGVDAWLKYKRRNRAEAEEDALLLKAKLIRMRQAKRLAKVNTDNTGRNDAHT